MDDGVTEEAADNSPRSPESSEGEKANASTLDREDLLRRFKKWFLRSKRHSEVWRKEAEEDFDFVAGRQWDEREAAMLREEMRPNVVFNRIAPVISAVSGTEVTNRQEIHYYPRKMGQAGADEMLTAAGKWFRDECNGEDEESDAFWDACVCGMGWTETRMDFELDENGAPLLERIDPLEMFWDGASKRRNLEDSRHVFRVKRVPLDEAKSLVADADTEDDDDFDATWAAFDDKGTDDETRQEARFYRPTKSGEKDEDDGLITLVECQWWERELVHAVADPDAGKAQFLSPDEFGKLSERMAELGESAPKSAKQYRRKYYRAWIGKTVLGEPEEAPYGNHFSYNAITGYRDRNKGTYYGIVRGMKDPQRWANKFLSQTMNIINKGAKGGAFVEKGFFDDEREAEKTYATSEFTYVKKNALSSGSQGFAPKPVTQLPQGLADLMAFSIQSIRDASGVNLELLGMKEQEQAGVLEAQRKKQAMAVLAVLFDSLRRYRKTQGRLLLWLIQNFVDDGRLIRVTDTDGGEQYIPFLRQPDIADFDVIVDDAPSSPQQKEIVGGFMSQMLPMVKDQMSPELWAAFLDYSPLPPSAAAKLKQAIQQGQMRNAQDAEQGKAISKAGAIAKVNETQSKAELNRAKAGQHLHGVHKAETAPPPMMVEPNNIPTQGSQA